MYDRLICDDCLAGLFFQFVSSAAFHPSKVIPQMSLLRAVEAMKRPIIVFPVRFNIVHMFMSPLFAYGYYLSLSLRLSFQSSSSLPFNVGETSHGT